MRVVALLLLAWLMIGFPVAMIALSLHWMATRRKRRTIPLVLASLVVASLLASCEPVTVEQIIIPTDGGHPVSAFDQSSLPAEDMASLPSVQDMAKTTASDMSSAGTSSDMSQSCVPRAAVCSPSQSCCPGFRCEDDGAPPDDMGHINPYCCSPILGPGCVYSVPVSESGCCQRIGGVACQNQSGIGVCCLDDGATCATDSDCCLDNATGLPHRCVNNACMHY